MKVLSDPNKFVMRVLGTQTPEEGVKFRESRFVITEGDAKYNTLTGESLLCADEETLIKRWFLFPEDMDETILAYMVRQKWLQNADGPGSQIKRKFIIFTTTMCNANCIYCYENGVKEMSMQKETAKDVAEYIMSHSNRDNEIRIRWFGGEPLANQTAIGIIADRLNEEGVRFTSEIFTNGDLLPKVRNEFLRALHIDHIQLTADDIGSEYDRIKGLPDGAWERLTGTMHRLSGLGIKVHLRTHYHPGEGPEAPIRVIDAVKDIERVRPYCTMLYEGGSEEDYRGLLKVEEHLVELGKRTEKFPVLRFGTSCMADNRKVACITTDGHLSPCEHHPYGENYGSIYEKKYDQSVLKRWKAKTRNHCGKCALYPSCGKQALCPAAGSCSEAEVDYQTEIIRKAMRAKIDDLHGNTDSERTFALEPDKRQGNRKL